VTARDVAGSSAARHDVQRRAACTRGIGATEPGIGSVRRAHVFGVVRDPPDDERTRVEDDVLEVLASHVASAAIFGVGGESTVVGLGIRRHLHFASGLTGSRRVTLATSVDLKRLCLFGATVTIRVRARINLQPRFGAFGIFVSD